MNGVLRQVQFLDQLALHRPDALPTIGEMQTALAPIGKTAARLHRIDDDPVVVHLQRHTMGRRGKGRFGFGLIPKTPVKGAIVRRLRMQGCATRSEIGLGWQIVNLQLDHLRGISGLCRCLGNHDRHRLADITHLVAGKDRTFRRRSIAAVAVLDQRAIHSNPKPCSLKIGKRENSPDPIAVARHLQIQTGDGAVGNRAAQNIGTQRAVWCDVVDIAALAGQEPDIFHPLNRLALAEFFHLRTCFCRRWTKHSRNWQHIGRHTKRRADAFCRPTVRSAQMRQ